MKNTEVKSPEKSTRDRSKFRFNGKQYGKGRLVLAVVEKYVEDHPNTTVKELKSEFADIHSLGGVQPLSTAKKLGKSHKRFFTAYPIRLSDGVATVCSDFGMNNIGKFLNKTKELGYRVKMAS